MGRAGVRAAGGPGKGGGRIQGARGGIRGAPGPAGLGPVGGVWACGGCLGLWRVPGAERG